MIQGSFFVNGTKFKLYCKERGIDEGANALIYIIKIYKYIISLCKLIRNLRIFITNKNLRRKN